MATMQEIENVLFNRLLGSLSVPVRFANSVKELAKPYVMAEYVPVSSQNFGIASGSKIQRGMLEVKVVALQGSFTKDTNLLTNEIVALFPFGLALACGGHMMRVSEEPFIQRPYGSNSAMITPVQVQLVLTGK